MFTYAFVAMAATREKPDLVVFTGDIISGGFLSGSGNF
jgi:predicted MPP superfamily phosphohydrolase